MGNWRLSTTWMSLKIDHSLVKPLDKNAAHPTSQYIFVWPRAEKQTNPCNHPDPQQPWDNKCGVFLFVCFKPLQSGNLSHRDRKLIHPQSCSLGEFVLKPLGVTSSVKPTLMLPCTDGLSLLTLPIVPLAPFHNRTVPLHCYYLVSSKSLFKNWVFILFISRFFSFRNMMPTRKEENGGKRQKEINDSRVTRCSINVCW